MKKILISAVGSTLLLLTGSLVFSDDPPEQKSELKAEFIGTESCLACHELSATFKDSHSKNLVNRKLIANDRTCETCHGPGSLHAEAAGDANHPGFATLKAFQKISPAEVNASCLECHKNTNRVHWQGGPHESRDLSCISCHSVHQSKSKNALLTKSTVRETCYECHRDIKGQMRRSAHMPIDEGKMTCTSCHNPHGTGATKQLKASSASELCQSCHTEKRGPFLWEHPPVRENCLSCHAAHGSHHDKMLVAKRPYLCQRCHTQTFHRSTLYGNSTVKGQSNFALGQSCVNCHTNIHGSNHPSGKFFTR